MNENEFDKLYVHFKRKSLNSSELAIAKRLRIDWEAYDRFRITSGFPRTISKRAAFEDVAHFFLLLRHAYSGYEYYSQITDFSSLEKLVIQRLLDDVSEGISSIKLCHILHQAISSEINDGHVWVEYADFEGLCLRSYFPYVTDVVVKKERDQFIVIRGDACIQTGVILQSADIHGELFATLVPDQSGECYLIGCYASDDPGYIKICEKHSQTHILKSCTKKTEPKVLYSLTDEEEYAIFTNPTYQIYEDSDEHEHEFFEIGKICAAKDLVIWDITNNHGGNSAYPESYLRGLNNHVCNEMDTAILHSPFLGNSDEEKFYEVRKAPECDNAKASFHGTLIIVMNKETGSSAELAALFAKSCKHVITAGAPSAGIGLFGEVRSYRLENSGILVGLPYKVFYEDNFEIGKGYMPDYLIDDEDPAEYLLKYILQECKGNGR